MTMKEEENVKEDKLLENPYDRMIAMLEEMMKERTTMMTNIMAKLEEVLRQQEQREAILLMTKDDTEDDSVDTESIDDVKLNLNNDTESIGAKENLSNDWSAWSDWTCEIESIDTTSTSLKQSNKDKTGIIITEQLEDQEIEHIIDVMIKPNIMKLQLYGNCMTLTISLSLWALLEDPDNRKEKLLLCDLEPDIYHNQQQKTIFIKKRIKKSSVTFECLWKAQ